MRRGEKWLTFALLIVLAWVINAFYIPAFNSPRQSRLPGLWNYANASVPIWDYSNYSPGVIEFIWNRNNPSYRECTTFTGPVYREDTDYAYNPAPDWMDWNPQPECWSCHTNTYTAYYNYTSMAHPGGNPMGYGER